MAYGALPANVVLALLLGACGRWLWHFDLPSALEAPAATPLFLAAGIGMAAVARCGSGMLPGVALGALLFQWPPASNDLAAIGAQLAVVAGAVLQAALGARAVLRWSGMALAGGGQVLRFLLIAMACGAIGASMALLPLVAMHLLGVSKLWPNWLNWWAGDTLGIVLGAPLLWTVLAAPRALWRARLLRLAAPLLLGALALTGAFARVSAWDQEQSRYLFQLKANEVGDLLQFQFNEHERFLFAVGKVFDESDIGSSAKFSRLARGYLDNRPELRLISLAKRVTGSERPAFEQWARAHISPAFHIKDNIVGDDQAGGRAEYFATTYIEPMAGNERALGIDLLSETVRANMVQRAVDRHLAAASAPLTLVQTGQRQQAVLLAQEIKQFSEGKQSAQTYGVLVAVIEIGSYLKRTMSHTDFDGFAVKFEDVSQAKPVVVVDELHGQSSPSDYQRPLSLGGRNYLLTLPYTPAMLQETSWQSRAVVVAGLCLLALLSLLLLLLTGHGEPARKGDAAA